jgi:hypothetical protein
MIVDGKQVKPMTILLCRTQGWQIMVCLLMSLMPWMGTTSVAATAAGTKPAAHHAPHHQTLITRKVVFKNAHVDFRADLPQITGKSAAIQRANREIRQVIYTSLEEERHDDYENSVVLHTSNYRAHAGPLIF